jgi:spermidine synthase
MTRYLLNTIVFISGAVLMSLEIVGSRVLAPYFGNSIFVWGSLISIVLAALSIGYSWGVKLSARNPSFARLLVLLLIPGLLIFVLPFIYPAINLWIAGIDFGARYNPLMASMIFFLLPGVFLGTISPYAIRLAATSLSMVGSTAGTLYAISTCGSIFGTLFTAFYLIPVIGVSNIIHSLGITLMFLSLLVWPLARSRQGEIEMATGTVRMLGALCFFVLAAPAPDALVWADTKTIYEKDSFYHRIRVEEEDEVRYLYFDRTLQSAVSVEDPTALWLLYSRYVSLGLAFQPEAKKMLMIGLGGGSIPNKYNKEFPKLEIDIAEIDPEVIQVAKKFFLFKEGQRMRVHAQDGRLFLTRTPARYDLIVLDAFNKDVVPFHLTTREFFTTANQKLAPNGSLVINVIGAVSGKNSKITRAIIKTLRGIFPQIYVFATRRAAHVRLEVTQNVIIIAAKDSQRLPIGEIVKRAESLGRDLFPKPINDIAVSYYDSVIMDHDVPVLTDDFAPTDSLLHP